MKFADLLLVRKQCTRTVCPRKNCNLMCLIVK